MQPASSLEAKETGPNFYSGLDGKRDLGQLGQNRTFNLSPTKGSQSLLHSSAFELQEPNDSWLSSRPSFSTSGVHKDEDEAFETGS